MSSNRFSFSKQFDVLSNLVACSRLLWSTCASLRFTVCWFCLARKRNEKCMSYCMYCKRIRLYSGLNKWGATSQLLFMFAICSTLSTELSLSAFIQQPCLFGWKPPWQAAVAIERACDCLICLDYISPQHDYFIPLHRRCSWSLAIVPLMSRIMKWMKCHFQSIALLIQLN